MKIHIFLFAMLLITIASCSSNREYITIDGNDQAQADDKKYDSYDATLRNNTLANVYVAVISEKTGEQVSGFGLGRKATVFVGEGNKLMLKNNTNRKVKVSAELTEINQDNAYSKAPLFKKTPVTPTQPTTESQYIDFTLQNKSLKSIPLLIPTVMNPSLSPQSKSGVNLKVGQEILFKFKGKKRVLLTVTSDIKDGDVLEVSELLKQRKQEILDSK